MAMACSYVSNNTSYGVRSISFPTTSHDPSTDSIKKELNGIETWVMSSTCKPSIEATYDGLMKLSRLYECLHEFTNLLCSTRNEKWVEELMDRLVGFLDVCDIIRDIMSRYKEHARYIQCALRRRKGDSSIDSTILQYNCLRKTVKKDVKRLIASLKQSTTAKSPDHHQHHEVSVVIKRVTEVTVSVLIRSLLMPFVMTSSQTPKANKWSMVVSKLIQRTRVSCEEHHYQDANDIKGLDAVLGGQCIKDKRFSSLWNDACIWETMEAQIERIEDALGCMFRSLIRTRASLLNVVSSY